VAAQKTYFRIYLESIFQGWVSGVSGVLSVIAWLLATVFQGFALPFWLAGAIALLFACYKTWRREYEKTEPKLILHDKVTVDPGAGETHYRVEIENVSLTTLENCGVFLVESTPPLRYTNVPLHHSGPKRNGSAQVSLNPGVKAGFDVFRVRGNDWQVTGAFSDREFTISQAHYRLLLRAHGKDARKADKYFILEPGEGGLPKLYPDNQPVP
jgi:hypothetical protein